MISKDKYVDSYNEAYAFVTPEFLSSENSTQLSRYLRENSHSVHLFLKKFFEDNGAIESLAGCDILEVGCGLGGLAQELSRYKANVQGVDISSLAIMGAKEINLLNKQNVEFSVFDVCSSKSLDKKYDYIIDSHTLHCLISEKERASYFNFVRNHLKPNGLFMVETMTYNTEIREPLGFDIDESYILHQETSASKLPIRRVLPSIELENEITSNGLNIHTFYYHHELSLNIFPEYPEYPVFRQPKIVRYSAKL